MSVHRNQNSAIDNDFEAEIRKTLQRTNLEKCNDEQRLKIPKLYGRSSHFLQNKCSSDFYIKKAKSNYSQDELNLDEQVQININILDLQNKLGVNIVQKNGQRKLGGPPPGWTGPPPGPGCEVFVGRIPRNIYEDVIYPIFRRIGEIYEMRLMMNFSGTNRGFCFIMYVQPELAQQAIKELNNYPIRPGWCIGVVASVNNCRLHVTDLPPQTDAPTLIKKIWPVCEDIDTITVYTNRSNPQIKHALISFKTHRSAAMARRRLLPERGTFFDKSEVKIDWAHPNISITNVIEESGFMDDERGIVMSLPKSVGGNSKKFNIEQANKVALKNARKKRPQNCCKLRNLDEIRNPHNQINLMQQISIKKDKFNRNVTNTSMELSNIKQHAYADYSKNDSFNDCASKQIDEFKYSMRSDESLSDFSKSSDCDEYKNASFVANTSTPCKNNQAILNPMNCSVVRYPWNSYVLNPPIRNNYQHFNYHNVQFPWRNVVNFKPDNIPIQIASMQPCETFNYAVPFFINNTSYNNVENVRPFNEGMRTARPILNRNCSFA